MIDVVMPQMGESIVEGTLTKWLKKLGDHVDRDEPLFEISTDKVDTEIPSPAAGVLSQVLVEEGKTVAISTVVGKIDESSGNGAAAPAPAKAEPVAAQAPEPPPPVHQPVATSAGPYPIQFPNRKSHGTSSPIRRPALCPRSSAKWRASIISI
jgi:pyruvate dehydrogenase E2 component (dihydrolipoamide acetyltransferase)